MEYSIGLMLCPCEEIIFFLSSRKVKKTYLKKVYRWNIKIFYCTIKSYLLYFFFMTTTTPPFFLRPPSSFIFLLLLLCASLIIIIIIIIKFGVSGSPSSSFFDEIWNKRCRWTYAVMLRLLRCLRFIGGVFR